MAYTTINKSTDYFNTKLYTGNGSTGHAITGVGFQPDLVWLKNRDVDDGHIWTDAVRGAPKSLASHGTFAEANNSENTQSLNSDGFTVGNNNDVNRNNSNFASWNWLANGAGSANTDGSINSTVSVNTTAGFSIVSYTGTGSNATVGHGLGVAPKVLILKSRTRSDGAWTVGSDMLGWTKFLYLNDTSAEQTLNLYQNTAPTSSVFYLSSDGGVNQSGGSMIGYAFAEKTGYSKFGFYTGNGNADGTFIYTGFKPAFVMIKNSTNAGLMWNIRDNKRETFNPNDTILYPNSDEVENAHGSNDVDWLSNGFKMRSTNGHTNGSYSGNKYIYMAFGQSIVGSNNVPCTAR
jgi:hypothetical protein